MVLVDRGGDGEEVLVGHPTGGEESVEPQVGVAEEQLDVGRFAVAPRAPDLLVVRVDRARRLGVGDPADARFVDAHPEGDGGDDDPVLIGEETVLDLAALPGRQTGVVRLRGHAGVLEVSGQVFGVVMGRDVHDARSARGSDVAQQAAVLGLLVGEGEDREIEVRPIESADHHGRAAHLQPVDDLLAHRWGGGGGQREDRWPPHRADRGGEPQVVGPEVLSPLADQVGLVDSHQLAAGTPRAGRVRRRA